MCDRPDVAQGTTLPDEDSKEYGTFWTVSCNDGYELSEPNTSTFTCASGGDFQEDPEPSCESKLNRHKLIE